MRGLNVDPLNPAGAPDPAALKALHFDAVRLVMRSGGQCEQYAKACKDDGLFVLGVLANESGGYILANVDLVQIGNEPDGAPPSSWVMSPQQYVDLWNLYRGTYPNLPMIAAGLSSGDPSWWATVAPQLDGCKGVAVHPYGKTLGEAKTLLAAYRAVRPSLGLYVSEWNRPAAEIPGYDWWLRQNTNGAWWFCWSDAMVPGFGLVKPELASFGGVSTVSPQKPPPADPPSIVQKPSPNYWPGRPSGSPIALVIHTMAGTIGATDGWFGNPASQVSAHYGVSLDGEVHQYVALEDRAWANGIREAGNHWPGPNVNPNDLTVSIETEDLGNAVQPVTDKQYAATLAVCKLALARYPSIQWVMGHNAISPSSRPNCPGGRWLQSGMFGQLAGTLNLKAVP